MTLSASDLAPEGLSLAAGQVDGVTLYRMDARVIPFEGEFDVIGAFDVIEHIQEDEAVLRQMQRACKQGGGIILTVPQHPFLWSRTDDYARHKRRYTRRELVMKVERAGFEVEHVTSFVFLLFPLMVVSRLLQRLTPARRDGIDPGFRIRRPLNRVFMAFMAVERLLLRRTSLPIGGSLLLAARKP